MQGKIQWRHPVSAFDDPDKRISDLDSLLAAVCCRRAVASWRSRRGSGSLLPITAQPVSLPQRFSRHQSVGEQQRKSETGGAV